MDLVTFLAVWGAIVATAAMVWNISRDLGDKGKLKLEAMIGRMYPDHTDRDYLVINITNVGKRPVLVKGLAAMKGRKCEGPQGLWLCPRGLPAMLKEGEFHIEYTHDFGFLDDDVEKIYVWDSAGREWKLPRKIMKRLRSDAKVEAQQGGDNT